MHHTGTSLLTALLQLAGVGAVTHEVAAEFLQQHEAINGAQLNPQGFYEPLEMQAMLLRYANHTWLSVCRLNASRFADVERLLAQDAAGGSTSLSESAQQHNGMGYERSAHFG